MLFRECIVSEVCKYFDEIDISRALCVCKSLNWLVKKHVTAIQGEYHLQYSQFTGLKNADFEINRCAIDRLPPNLTKLKIYDLSFDCKLLPKSLSSLTITADYGLLLRDEVLEYLSPSLTKLNTYHAPIAYSTVKLTNLLDLRIRCIDNIESLPPNLTRLDVYGENYNLDYIWKMLPKSLTHLDLYCMLRHVYMKDLPLAIKHLDVFIDYCQEFEYFMKSDDHFNSGIETLHTNINAYDSYVPNIIVKLPITITYLSISIHEDVDMGELSAALPRTLLTLEMYSISDDDIDDSFYKQLPPNLTSLCNIFDIGDEKVLHPSLLPRSLITFYNHTSNVSIDECGDFPPNIQYINSISVTDDGVADFSMYPHLLDLNITCTAKILLPPSLKHFKGNLSSVTLHRGVVTCFDTSDVTPINYINNLPDTILYLNIISLETRNDVVFPPELRKLRVVNSQLTREQLTKLPNTLTRYVPIYDSELRICEEIDGNKIYSVSNSTTSINMQVD